jgi:hypothetical protein
MQCVVMFLRQQQQQFGHFVVFVMSFDCAFWDVCTATTVAAARSMPSGERHGTCMRGHGCIAMRMPKMRPTVLWVRNSFHCFMIGVHVVWHI